MDASVKKGWPALAILACVCLLGPAAAKPIRDLKPKEKPTERPNFSTIDGQKVHEVGGPGGLRILEQLSGTDPRDSVRQGMFAKVFHVKLIRGKTYTIDMQAPLPLDSYLRLEDLNKRQLAEDDDGGGFPNARIIFQCNETAVFRVIATSFGANQQGAFTLTVRD